MIWIIALGITLSRLYLQVHYLSDILGGVVVGCFSALGGIYLYTNRYQRYRQNQIVQSIESDIYALGHIISHIFVPIIRILWYWLERILLITLLLTLTV